MARAVSKFVPLRCRTPYSILEGAIKVAVGLTDTNNICAGLEFSEKMSGAGIQPIMGCTLTVDLETGDEALNPHGGKEFAGTLVFLAQSEKGYENLMKLSSFATLDAGPTELGRGRWLPQ